MSKKLRSVRSQLKYAMDQSNRQGVGKYDDRQAGTYREHYIYSSAVWKAIGKTIDNFSAWYVEKGYPKVLVKDIDPQIWEEYLHEKQLRGEISDTSARNYANRIIKIGKMVSAVYGDHPEWRPEPYKIDATILRDKMMDPEDFARIYDQAKKMGRKGNAVRITMDLGRACGLRIDEVAMLRPEQIMIEDGYLQVEELHLREGTKGGKWRDVRIRPEYVDRIKEIRDQAIKNGWERVTQTSKCGTLSDYFRDVIKSTDESLAQKYYGTTEHAIRKLYATERVLEETKAGKPLDRAWSTVSVELGHGQDRRELQDVYDKSYEYKDEECEDEYGEGEYEEKILDTSSPFA